MEQPYRLELNTGRIRDDHELILNREEIRMNFLMSTKDAMRSRGMDGARMRRFSLRPGEAWAFAGSVSYALYNFVSRIAVVSGDPLVAPIFRMIPTLAFAWHQSRHNWSQVRPSAAHFMGWRVFSILSLGGVTTALGNVAFFYALQIGGVVLTAPVLATLILWSAIFAAIFLREPVAPRMAIGIGIAALGIGMLSYGRAAGGEVGAGALPAVLLALSAAAGWAATSSCQRYALQRGVEAHMTIAAGQSGGVLLLIGLLFLVGRGPLLWTTDLRTIGLFALVGIFGTMAMVFVTYALSYTTVANASTISGTNPVIAMALAVLFLGERLNWLMAIGAALTIAGVIFFQLSKSKQI
jgi:drug/metabolite transporter (DMT)-like permease